MVSDSIFVPVPYADQGELFLKGGFKFRKPEGCVFTSLCIVLLLKEGRCNTLTRRVTGRGHFSFDKFFFVTLEAKIFFKYLTINWPA
jgi:hypothetical protein